MIFILFYGNRQGVINAERKGLLHLSFTFCHDKQYQRAATARQLFNIQLSSSI